MHPFDLRQAKGLTTFEHVSTSGEVRGRALAASALQLLAPGSGIDFRRGEGPVDARVIMDHGRFADGTRVLLEATDGEVEAAGLAFEAPIRIELGVHGDLAIVDARLTGLRVSRRGAGHARVASIVAKVTSRHLLLSHAFDDTLFAFDVRGAEVSDIAAWTDLLPSMSTFAWRSGLVAANGHAEGSFAEGRGAATITADDVEGRLGRVTVAGKLGIQVELKRGIWRGRSFDFSDSGVAFGAASVRSDPGAVAVVVIPSLTAVAQRFVVTPLGLDGHVSIDLPAAELVDLGGLRGLLPSFGFVIEGGGGRARLHADVDLGSAAMRGDGEVVARGIRARAGSTEVFGDLDCTLRATHTGDRGARPTWRRAPWRSRTPEREAPRGPRTPGGETSPCGKRHYERMRGCASMRKRTSRRRTPRLRPPSSPRTRASPPGRPTSFVCRSSTRTWRSRLPLVVRSALARRPWGRHFPSS